MVTRNFKKNYNSTNLAVTGIFLNEDTIKKKAII